MGHFFISSGFMPELNIETYIQTFIQFPNVRVFRRNCQNFFVWLWKSRIPKLYCARHFRTSSTQNLATIITSAILGTIFSPEQNYFLTTIKCLRHLLKYTKLGFFISYGFFSHWVLFSIRPNSCKNFWASFRYVDLFKDSIFCCHGSIRDIFMKTSESFDISYAFLEYFPITHLFGNLCP